MPTYRLLWEPQKAGAGVPWGIEDATGERHYTASVRVETHAQTVIVPGEPRDHGYLEVQGRLEYDPAGSRIVREDDAEG